MRDYAMMTPPGTTDRSSGAVTEKELPTAGTIPDAAPFDTPTGLSSRLASGLIWTGGVRWTTQLVTWASMLFIARLLSPEDYGLLGMATVYLGVITLLSEFGLGTAITTLRDLPESQIAQLNSMAILFGGTAFLISCLMAAPLGQFFRAPELPPVIIVLSFGFIISGFRTVPLGLLGKELRFKGIAIIEGTRAIVTAIAMVALAVAGFRYWTLVIGGLLGTLLSTIALVRLRPHSFALPKWTTLTKALSFSFDVAAARFSWYVYSNADFAIAGRILGATLLGSYTFAWTLASIPVEKVTTLVAGVAPGLFSAIQNDRAQLRRYMLAMTKGLAVVTFPAAVGLAFIADDLVNVLLGQHWSAAILPLRLLAISACLRSITPLIGFTLTVTGDTRFSMWNSVAAAVLLPLAFVIGGQTWGIAGVAVGWVVVHPLITLPLYWRLLSRLQLPVRDYLTSLAPAFYGTVAMLGVLSILSATATPYLERPTWLAVQAAAGASVYAGYIWLCHRKEIQRTIWFVRGARTPA